MPTALGLGIGGAQRSAIAVTIIGGQSLCLFLTLLVVPVAYVKFDALEQSVANQQIKAWLRKAVSATLGRLRPPSRTHIRSDLRRRGRDASATTSRGQNVFERKSCVQADRPVATHNREYALQIEIVVVDDIEGRCGSRDTLWRVETSVPNGNLESDPRSHPQLPVRGVIDVRVFRDTKKPPAPIDIRADGPGSHQQSFVAVAALVHNIDRQPPVGGQITSEVQMRVALSCVKAVVVDGVYRQRVARGIAVACSELDVVVGIKAQVPVRAQVQSGPSLRCRRSGGAHCCSSTPRNPSVAA